MPHTQIVTAKDLDKYSDTRQSQSDIPELINHLIKQSCVDLEHFRMPYGDDVNLPGWDGVVKTPKGFYNFVPKGESFWEIGTSTNPENKAKQDFKKRTDATDAKVRAQYSFVFVTPRSSWSELKQTKWKNDNLNSGWKSIVIIDGVQLADWINHFPAIGKWMAKKLNLTNDINGISTLTEHWENLQLSCASKLNPLPAELFTIGRENACKDLEITFNEKGRTIRFLVENQFDLRDFVAAFLASLDKSTSELFSNNCLYINDDQAWRTISDLRKPHVLIADVKLGLETEQNLDLVTLALKNNHAVVIPICGATNNSNSKVLQLNSPSRNQIRSALEKSNSPRLELDNFSRIGDRRLSALRRYLQGGRTLPPYAEWQNARFIAQAGLIGQWDGDYSNDRFALTKLVGEEYKKTIAKFQSDILRSDCPLMQQNNKYRLIAREEVLCFLGKWITNDDLDSFQKMAIDILSETDPQFNLPKKERYLVHIRGKVFQHSVLLRKGVAETLALLGYHYNKLTICSQGKVETTVTSILQKLLNQADWLRWASLNSVMPLLAEAAPDEFLKSLESALNDLNQTPFHRIFTEEDNDVLFAQNYMTGLLWGLELLAWHSDHLGRVSLILAYLASIDPGGSWGNRPKNSLRDIFLPLHVQTVASFETCKSAIRNILKDYPTIGWQLILELISPSGVTNGSHRPTYRKFIPEEFTNKISTSEYIERITIYANMAIDIAKEDSNKLEPLIELLIDKLSVLPPAPCENLLKHLTSGEILSLSEPERLPLWKRLDGIVRKHKKHSHTNWALPKEVINKIEQAAKELAPASPLHRYQYLFDNSFSLLDGKDSWEKQEERLSQKRQKAISELIRIEGIQVILDFIDKVSCPDVVGRTLQAIASDEVEQFLLPSLLEDTDNIKINLLSEFVLSSYWKKKLSWVDKILKFNDWSFKQKTIFLTYLPFEKAIWERVESQLEAKYKDLYWKKVKVNTYEPNCDFTPAIRKLLKYKRDDVAVMCAAHMKDNPKFDETLATRTLLAVLDNENAIKGLDQHQTIELINHLQQSTKSNKESLFKIEWYFLPWLDQFSLGSPITLEKQMSSNPDFFVKIIQLVYKSKNHDEKKECLETSKHKQLFTNAYKLLSEWKIYPGKKDDETLDTQILRTWVDKVMGLTKNSGHCEVAQNHIGQVLVNTPSDSSGLWINTTVAEILNQDDKQEMRSGFTIQLFNNRGVYRSTSGEGEKKLAQDYQEKAEALDKKGYFKFASAMRDLSKDYLEKAEQKSEQNLFE